MRAHAILIFIYIYMQYLNKDSPIQGLSSLPTDLPEDWPMAWSAWASASDPPTQRPRPQPVPRTHRGNLCAAASWCCCRAGRRIQGQNVGKKLYIVKMWGLNSSEPCWSEVLIPYIYILTVYIYNNNYIPTKYWGFLGWPVAMQIKLVYQEQLKTWLPKV